MNPLSAIKISWIILIWLKVLYWYDNSKKLTGFLFTFRHHPSKEQRPCIYACTRLLLYKLRECACLFFVCIYNLKLWIITRRFFAILAAKLLYINKLLCLSKDVFLIFFEEVGFKNLRRIRGNSTLVRRRGFFLIFFFGEGVKIIFWWIQCQIFA